MKKFFLWLFLILSWSGINSQVLFRSGIFLHHSTGGCIWGPNGSNTSVPAEMTVYNTLHGYTGGLAVTMNEEWWSPSDNEWVTQHAFFEDPSPVTGIGYYLTGNKIIVIKSCFPASAMTGVGQASDTNSPWNKTLYNYKWHWRHIVTAMESHPGNFFVIWTNAPLEPYSTNPSEAALSHWFSTWAKDTLAQGMDPAFGPFPPNLYVFDFFHKLTGPNGMMLPQYAAGPGDSHPNAAATALVAPQFVSEIFNHSIAYETVYAMVPGEARPDFHIVVIPDPAGGDATIRFEIPGTATLSLTIFDMLGRPVATLIREQRMTGGQIVRVPCAALAPGTYLLRLTAGSEVRSVKFLIGAL